MILLSKPNPTKLSLGLHIKLAESDERNSASITHDGPFRKYVVLRLKGNDSVKNLETLLYVIAEIENGARFPIRMDWENAKSFFSINQMYHLSAVFGEIPFYLYNANQLRKSSLIDIEDIERKYRNKVRRARRLA